MLPAQCFRSRRTLPKARQDRSQPHLLLIRLPPARKKYSRLGRAGWMVCSCMYGRCQKRWMGVGALHVRYAPQIHINTAFGSRPVVAAASRPPPHHAGLLFADVATLLWRRPGTIQRDPQSHDTFRCTMVLYKRARSPDVAVELCTSVGHECRPKFKFHLNAPALRCILLNTLTPAKAR